MTTPNATECHPMPCIAKKLNPQQQVAVQLIAQGMTRNRISQELGIDPSTLSRWRRSEIFQIEVSKQLDSRQQEGLESFRATYAIALERLSLLVASTNPVVALRAIDLVLSQSRLSFPPRTAPAPCHDFDGVLDLFK